MNQSLHNYFHSQVKNWFDFEGHKFKSQGHGNIFQQTDTNWRITVDFYLVHDF